MAIGDVGAEFLGHGVVLVRIKGFTFGLDFFEAVVFQKILKLFLDHRHSLKDRGGVGGGLCGVKAEFEIIDDGEESLEQAIVGIADGFLFFTQGTLAEIIEISAGAER